MAKNMSAGPVPGSARAWALLTLGIVLAVGLAAATPADAAPYTGALKGRFFVSAEDGQRGCELWTSDGTARGTRLFKQFTPGPDSTLLWGLQRVGKRL